MSNPKLSNLLRITMIIEAIVLSGASVGLIIFPALSRTQWPWEVTPFNTGFLGAIYTASLVVVTLLALNPRWSPARVLLPMVCSFTVWAMLMSFVYIARFDLSKPTTWAWYVFYVLLPAATAYFIWRYQRLPLDHTIAVPQPASMFLTALGIILLIYTAALILFPSPATSFWPWAIDDFHARMYASMFLAGGVGTLLISRRVAQEELRLMGIGQAAFAALVLAELFIVDSQVHRVNWSVPTTWLWIAIFASAIITGAAYIALSRQSLRAVPASATS